MKHGRCAPFPGLRHLLTHHADPFIHLSLQSSLELPAPGAKPALFIIKVSELEIMGEPSRIPSKVKANHPYSSLGILARKHAHKYL